MVSATQHPVPEDLLRVLATVVDPELPVNIVDLGLVERVTREEDGAISVDLIPTFIGCPALDMIRTDVIRALAEHAGALAGDSGGDSGMANRIASQITVQFVNDPPWSPDRITDAGRQSLKEHGVSVPDRALASGFTALTSSIVHCPWCNSKDTQRESPFGPTRCRMIYYCPACKNTFEHMKRLAQ